MATLEEQERQLERRQSRLKPKKRTSSTPKKDDNFQEGVTFKKNVPQIKGLSPQAQAERKAREDEIKALEQERRQTIIERERKFKQEEADAIAQAEQDQKDKERQELKEKDQSERKARQEYSQSQAEVREQRQKEKYTTPLSSPLYAPEGLAKPQVLKPDDYGNISFYTDNSALFSQRAIKPDFDTYAERTSGYSMSKKQMVDPSLENPEGVGSLTSKEIKETQKSLNNIKNFEKQQQKSIQEMILREQEDFASGYKTKEQIKAELQKVWAEQLSQLTSYEQAEFIKNQNQALQDRGINVPFSEYKLDPLKYDKELEEQSQRKKNFTNLQAKQLASVIDLEQQYLDNLNTQPFSKKTYDSKAESDRAKEIEESKETLGDDSANPYTSGYKPNINATDPNNIPLTVEINRKGQFLSPATPSVSPANDETPYQYITPAERKELSGTANVPPQPPWELLARLRGTNTFDDQFLTRDQLLEQRNNSYNPPSDIPQKYHVFDDNGKDITLGTYGIDSRIKNWGLSEKEYRDAVKFGYVDEWYDGIHEDLLKKKKILDEGVKQKETAKGRETSISIEATEVLAENKALNTMATGTANIQPVSQTTEIALDPNTKIDPKKVDNYVDTVAKVEEILVTKKPLDTSVHDATQNPENWDKDTSAYIDKEGGKKQLGIWSFSGYSQLYPSKNVKDNEYPSTIVWQSGEDTWQKVNLETGMSSTYSGKNKELINEFTGLSKKALDKIKTIQPPTPNLPASLVVTKTQRKAPAKSKKFNVVGNNGRQWVAGVTKGDIRFRLATKRK